MTQKTTTIQDEQRSRTRERIMRGLAAELNESGPHGLSIQSVADRAGVSHRTVYRHYGSKDELIQAFGAWVDEHLQDQRVRSMPESLEDLAAALPAVMNAFDASEELVEAYVRVSGVEHGLEIQRKRTQKFSEIVDAEAGDVSPSYRRAIAAMLRNISSSHAWWRARRDFDIDAEALGAASSWLVELVLEALEKGDVPEDWTHEP